MDIEHLNTPLTLDFLLENACSSPEDFGEWHAFQEKKEAEARKVNSVWQTPHRTYPGYMRYIIDTHCQRIVIIARRRNNGTYEIQNYLITEKP